jgi:ribosomal protein L16/L10AE
MFKADSTQLCFGKYGMKSCKAGRISYQAIEVAHCIISKRISKK